MRKQVIRFLLPLAICTVVGCETQENFIVSQGSLDIHEYLHADQTFDATSHYLADRGMGLDWHNALIDGWQKEYEHLHVSIPLVGDIDGVEMTVGELSFTHRWGEDPKISVVEYFQYDEDVANVVPPSDSCGDWVYMDSCYTAYQINEPCSGGNLWRRDRNDRQIYETGRKLSGVLDYIVDCNRLYSSSGCFSACFGGGLPTLW